MTQIQTLNQNNLKIELSKTELEKRAREIVSSKKHQKFTNQTDLFLSKIHNKNFLTERIIDEENQTYRYDLIEERLSMTSFKSVEEFIQEYEKLIYNAQKFVEGNSDLRDPLLLEVFEKEILKQEETDRLNYGQRGCAEKFRCISGCAASYSTCKGYS